MQLRERFEGFKAELRRLIPQVEVGFEERFGYPFGSDSNYVTDGVGATGCGMPPVLEDFYASVGEVALADIHVGFFIHPASTARTLPTRVVCGRVGMDVVTFGSDGGGGLLALDVARGEVHYLSGGAVEGDVYRVEAGSVPLVASDFPLFLDGLLLTVRECMGVER